VSSSRDNVVPQMTIRSPRLRPGKFVLVDAKRVLQQYPHIASFRCGAEFGRYRSIADIGQARTPKCKSGSDLAIPSVPGYRNFPMAGVPIYISVGAPGKHVPKMPGLWRGADGPKATSNRARPSNATASLRPIAEWRRSNRQTAHIRHHALTRFTVLRSSWFVMDLTQGSTRDGRERLGMSKVEIQS
jgi:hypothetical protein